MSHSAVSGLSAGENAHGGLDGGLASADAIPERQEIERLQQQGRERLELALAGGELGMWDWYVPSGLLMFNARWAEMLGESPEQLAPHIASWRSRLHPDDRLMVRLAWIAHLRGKTPAYESEHRLRHRDGHWVWIHDHGKVVERDPAGRPLRAIGTHRDVSAHKQFELQQEAQMQLLKMKGSALSAVSQGVLITDAEQRVLYVNGAFERMTCFSMAELFGRDCGFLQGPDELSSFKLGIAKALESMRSFDTEVRLYRKNGSVFWSELSITPVFDGEGRVSEFVGVLHDIAARKRDEEALQRQAKRIGGLSRHLVEKQEETRRRLACDLHDRTSPNLAAVSINLALITAALTTDGGSDPLDLPARLADTRALIDDTIASIREISAELRPSLLDNVGLAAAMESYARSFFRRCQVAVDLQLPKPAIRLDSTVESGLFRIYQEALTNVAKHARASSVVVRLARCDAELHLDIDDDGIGFEVLAALSPAAKGGIGLVSMREMAEFLGGSFVIHSGPGQGARIKVRVPLGNVRECASEAPDFPGD